MAAFSENWRGLAKAPAEQLRHFYGDVVDCRVVQHLCTIVQCSYPSEVAAHLVALICAVFPERASSVTTLSSTLRIGCEGLGFWVLGFRV